MNIPNHSRQTSTIAKIVTLIVFTFTVSPSLIAPLPANATSTTITSKIPSRVELLKQKRAIRKLALLKKLAERRQNAKPEIRLVPPASISPSVPLTTDYDEYQVPSLTQDDYETRSAPVIKKTTPSKSTIEKTFFTGIELKETVPTGFFKNEVYALNGTVTSGSNLTTMFAFLNYQDTNQKDQFINFETEAKNNIFSVPLYFENEGSFSLGLVPGTNGKSKIQEIVTTSLESKNEEISMEDSADPRISYDQNLDKSFISWTRSEDGIYRITFEQGSEKITYITRQNVSTLPIRYADFKKFKPGNIRINVSIVPRTLSGQWKIIGTSTTPITYHGFRTIEKSSIEVSGTVPSVISTIAPITIQGTALTNLENEAFITNAQGLTEKVTLRTNNPLISTNKSTPSTIAKGSTFELAYTPKTTGRIIMEINDEDGSAALNIPVYIGTGTPLIPDYLDINDVMKLKEKNINLSQDREYIVGLINNIRTGLGKKAVTLNASLSALAQKHSEDMVSRNFFGHVNPDGATPEDRRKKDMIPTEVGENLAYSQSLLSAMQGLLRSPIHRANILTDNWTSVGIGITKDTNSNSLKIVQEFAPAILTSERLNQIQADMLSGLNQTRNAAQISSLSEDAALTSLAKKWSDHLAKTDEFGITTQDGQSLSQKINDANITSSVQIFVFGSNSANKLVERILEPSSSMEPKWTKIGLGVSVTPLGEIKITMLLSK